MASEAPDPARSITLHATTVDLNGKGVLLVGGSGSGKSALALQLMALGAQLVADDGTHVFWSDGFCMASAPHPIAGIIEARGIGLLRADAIASTRLTLAIDMDKVESERLPPERHYCHDFISLPCLYKVDAPYFAAGVIQYLKAGRQDTE